MIKKLFIIFILLFVLAYVYTNNKSKYRYNVSNESFSKFDWVNDFPENFMQWVHIVKAKIDSVRESLFKTQKQYEEVKTGYEDAKKSYEEIKTTIDETKQMIDNASGAINTTKWIIDWIWGLKDTFDSTWLIEKIDYWISNTWITN